MQPIILAIMKDTGGTNALLPVLKELRSRYRIIHIADGIAPTLLKKKNIAFQTISVRQNINQFLKKVKPAVIFSTMCSGGGIGREFLREGNKLGVPTVALQDFWGARLNKEYRDRKFWPNYLLVPDASAKKIALRLWKGYSKTRVIISGYTAFHDLPSPGLANKIHRRLREQVRVAKPWPIVVFAGQLAKTARSLARLIQALNSLPAPVYFMADFHPRMKSAAPKELRRSERALRDFTNGILLNPKRVSFRDKIIMSDVVVSMFSTALIEGVFWRKQVIALLFPDAGLIEFQKTGLRTFPLVDLKAAYGISTIKELKIGLRRAVRNKLPLAKYQRIHFPNQHKSPKRVARFISSLIKNGN